MYSSVINTAPSIIISLQILNKPIAYDGTGFLGVKEILDQQDEAKKDEIMREMERRHKEKMDLVRNI